MSPAGNTERVAVDASVLINFLVLDRIDLLAELPGVSFVIPEPVVAEIRRPDQIRILRESFKSEQLGVVRVDTPNDVAEIAGLRHLVGHGEAACLVLAASCGLRIACDERGRFLRLAEERIGRGRILTTPGLIVRAIRADLIAVQEADEMKATLERHRFRMPFGSFRERVL